MKNYLMTIAFGTFLASCGADQSSSRLMHDSDAATVVLLDSYDPAAVSEEKMRSALPISFYSGTYSQNISFENLQTGKMVFSVASKLKLYGKSSVTIKTKYHDTRVDAWDSLNRKMDTVAYLYSIKDDGSWGNLIAVDDNGGDAKYSNINIDLDKGDYKVVVRRRYLAENFPLRYTPIADLQVSCEGEGCQAPRPAARACINDGDYDCVFGEALGFGVVDERVTQVTNPAELSNPIKDSLEMIDGWVLSRFEGVGDYSANVDAVYEIYRSEADRTIVGYGVVAFGSGEPDYNEVILYGIDLEGNIVWEMDENW